MKAYDLYNLEYEQFLRRAGDFDWRQIYDQYDEILDKLVENRREEVKRNIKANYEELKGYFSFNHKKTAPPVVKPGGIESTAKKPGGITSYEKVKAWRAKNRVKFLEQKRRAYHRKMLEKPV